MLATFPLSLVRFALSASSAGATDASKAAYRRPLLISEPAPAWLHCGSLPLVSAVSCAAWLPHTPWKTVRGCYINSAGQHVYPA